MQPRSVQCAPISAPRITTARSIVVCSPTVTPRSSTTRPPIRAPSPIRQPLSTSADGDDPAVVLDALLDAQVAVAHALGDAACATVPSRMSKVPSR